MTCLKTSTTGIDTMDEPIKQLRYTYMGFKFMAIPNGIAPLSSITGTIEININFIYSINKIPLHHNL